MAEGKKNISIVWSGGIAGSGKLKGEYLDTEVAIPQSLKGSGNGTEPQELLVSSATTCYTETLASILESRQIPVDEVTLNSEITSSNGGIKITHDPQIALSAGATEQQNQTAQKAIDLADKGCPIGNLLKKAGVEIEIKGRVFSN